MAANVQTGKCRTVKYCGIIYDVVPGESYGNKQVWRITADGVEIHQHVSKLSRCVYWIHEHAVESKTFPEQLSDGLDYHQLLTAVTR